MGIHILNYLNDWLMLADSELDSRCYRSGLGLSRRAVLYRCEGPFHLRNGLLLGLVQWNLYWGVLCSCRLVAAVYLYQILQFGSPCPAGTGAIGLVLLSPFRRTGTLHKHWVVVSDPGADSDSTPDSTHECDWVCWVQRCVYVPILVFGLPLILAALWQLLFRIRRWSESTVYLSNLIINDSLLMLSLPFKIHAYKKHWNLGQTFCSLLESLLYVNIYGSIMLSVCIAVDRYIALQFPFAARRLRSPRKAVLVCLIVWMVVIGWSVPIYRLHDNPENKTFFCFEQFSNSTWTKSWILASMETVFCSSALVMVFCSMRVVQILHKLRERYPGDSKLRNNKSMKIVLSNLVVFLTCFIPYHIAAPIYFHAKTGKWEQSTIVHLRYFVHISICISNVNILADGACYYFILKENLESAKQERRMAIHVRETRIRPSKSLTVGEIHNGAPKATDNTEICVDTGFT